MEGKSEGFQKLTDIFVPMERAELPFVGADLCSLKTAKNENFVVFSCNLTNELAIFKHDGQSVMFPILLF